MVEIQKHLPTVNQALFTAVAAVAANGLLFGLAGKVQQLPTASINSALTSTVASTLAALLGQGVYSMTLKKEGDEEKTWTQTGFKAAVIAAFVVGANLATTVDALKSRVSFLDMDVKSALAHSAFSALGIVGFNHVMAPKEEYKGTFADDHAAVADPLTAAQKALAAKVQAKEDNKAELAEFNKTKAAYDAFVGKFTFTEKADREAIADFKKTAAYTNVV